MKNWKNDRPDGFDAQAIAKPIKAKEPSGKWVSQLDVELVEAGADAMHKADVEWLEKYGHQVGIRVSKPSDSAYIFTIPLEDWQAFREIKE